MGISKKPSVVKLPGKRNYAIISANRIVFALDADDSELNSAVTEEECNHLNLQKISSEHNTTEMFRESTSLAIIPTLDCNLKCVYCYARGGDEKTSLELETAQKAISAVSKECDSADYLDLYLVGGGEPLLNFNLVKEIVSFSESVFHTVRLHIVSNGTFDDQVIDWLASKDCQIRISFDGAPQNIQRPYREKISPTSPIVKENIIKLIKKGVPVTVQCIVTNEGLSRLSDTVLEVAGLGVKIIKIEPMLATDISRGGKSLMPNPITYADTLLNVIKLVAESNIDIKIDTGYFSIPSFNPYCGMGYNNRILTPNGLITACMEVARLSDPYSEHIIYGKITDTGINTDPEKLDFLKKVNPTSSPACETCNLRLICHGGCPMANIWQTGIPPTRSIFTCSVEKRIIPQLLLWIAINPNISKIVMEDANFSFFN